MAINITGWNPLEIIMSSQANSDFDYYIVYADQNYSLPIYNISFSGHFDISCLNSLLHLARLLFGGRLIIPTVIGAVVFVRLINSN